jgi:hypothetical protein
VHPYMVAALRGKRVTDSLFQALRPETRRFAREFHHVLLGAGLSDGLCEALDRLQSKGLTALRPLAILAAMYDGALLITMAGFRQKCMRRKRCTPSTKLMSTDGSPKSEASNQGVLAPW